MFDTIQEALHQLSPLDIAVLGIDFVLVFILIYGLLLVVRGTRAVPLLVVLLVLIIVFFATKEGGPFDQLQTLHWLLDQFIASLSVLMVILFQNDIRRGLSNVMQYFSDESTATDANLIEQLVKASSELSGKRLGGLVAIERQSDLSRYAANGVEMDAMLRNETLFAVFNPAYANPLHDGAVVVRGSRIVAGACFLPLTSNPRVDKRLGTRHRAAIGLSEDTDAVVLVVSEETGHVSLAVGGDLMRDLDSNELRGRLQELLGTERRQEAEERASEPERVVESRVVAAKGG